MANPRRTYNSGQLLPTSGPVLQFQSQSAPQIGASIVTSLKIFLKNPRALPFLLFFFVLLTWISLRFHRGYPDSDFHRSSLGINDGGLIRVSDANAVKFPSSSRMVMKDKRGWLANPVSLILDAGLPGGATSCASVHIGEIRPGSLRGNHRHHFCNETFIIWGARTLFRLENEALPGGYSEVVIEAEELGLAASPRGTAHALLNVDVARSTFFLGCQDNVANENGSSVTDNSIWKDIRIR